jgi:biopolymer transport protein ExbD
MKIVNQRKNFLKSEINITPFTDVVLVLLIIFMVTTPIIIQSGIKVNIPESRYGDKNSGKEFEIVIKSEKEIFFNNVAADKETLKKNISDYAKSKPDQPLVIRADRNIKYYVIVNIMELARESGVAKISLNVEKRDK